MSRFTALLFLLVACTSDVDEGTPLPRCKECGPGAVRTGRFFSSLEPVPIVANRTGTIAGVTDDGLVWLRDDFTVEHSMPFKHERINIAIDDAGGGAMTFPSDPHDPGSFALAVIALAPDHSQRWNIPLGVQVIGTPVANSEMIVVPASPGSQSLYALRAADGSIAWRKQTRAGVAVAFAADGTLIMADAFSGTLDLGGTTTPLVATGTDLFVAAIDPLTGDARWATRLETDDEPQFIGLGVGPAGQIAISWSVPASLALLDAAGNVRWTLPVEPQPSGRVPDLVPQGDRVLMSSKAYNVGAPPPTESAVAQYSASGLDWRRTITGIGNHEVKLLTLAGDRLIASISSTGNPGPASTTIGDVTYKGEGVAIVELEH